jgi:cytoskeletal protein RodZ
MFVADSTYESLNFTKHFSNSQDIVTMAAGAEPLRSQSNEKRRIPYWWMYTPVFVASVAVAIIGVALGNADTQQSTTSTSTTTTTTSSWSTSYDATLGIGQDRCTIDRVPEHEMTPERFTNEYWQKRPVILLRDS